MIEDLLARVDTGKLYQPFLAALRELLTEASSMGLDFYCISGFRSYSEQNSLYEHGRTTPGKIITNAKGGESSHNFGIAVDVALDSSTDRGLQPMWNADDYEPLRALSLKHGLVWGGTWKIRDCAHIQIPNYITAIHLEPLRYAYELAGLPSVFEYLSKGGSNGVNLG